MHAITSQQMTLRVNGAQRRVTTDPLRPLAAVLRDDLQLTGTKLGCEAGDCGSCSVLLDGMAVASCLLPVAHARGHDITTVEGLADRPAGRALLATFRSHNACQCGFCIPGILVRAAEIVEQGGRLDAERVAFQMAGNLCRCTGYESIVGAVLDAMDSTAADAVPGAVGRDIADSHRSVDGEVTHRG